MLGAAGEPDRLRGARGQGGDGDDVGQALAGEGEGGVAQGPRRLYTCRVSACSLSCGCAQGSQKGRGL